jgi:hypothetical protein
MRLKVIITGGFKIQSQYSIKYFHKIKGGCITNKDIFSASRRHQGPTCQNPGAGWLSGNVAKHVFFTTSRQEV